MSAVLSREEEERILKEKQAIKEELDAKDPIPPIQETILPNGKKLPIPPSMLQARNKQRWEQVEAIWAQRQKEKKLPETQELSPAKEPPANTCTSNTAASEVIAEEVPPKVEKKEETPQPTPKASEAPKKKTPDAVAVKTEDDWIKKIMTCNHTVAEGVGAYMSTYEDPEFEAFKADIKQRYSMIRRSDNMPPAVVRQALMDIDQLRQDLFDTQVSMREWLACIGKNTTMDLYVLEGMSEGNNENNRRRNALRSLVEYKSQGKTFNMLYCMTAMARKKAFIDSVYEELNQLQSRLINITATNKVDNALIMASEGKGQ